MIRGEPQEFRDMDNNDLAAMVKAVGNRFGYEDATASCSPMNEFKVKWTRTYKWISLDISDYLDDAPEDVMECLLTTIFRRIAGEDSVEYGQPLVDWLRSEGFVRSKQSLFVRRFRGLSLSTEGKHRDLTDSYRRLIDKGLVEEDPLTYIGWAIYPSTKIVGKTSAIMKVIAISEVLDSEAVSEDVLDYCLYSQLARVKLGFNPGPKRRGIEYDALLDKYPDRRVMDRKLECMNMHI